MCYLCGADKTILGLCLPEKAGVAEAAGGGECAVARQGGAAAEAGGGSEEVDRWMMKRVCEMGEGGERGRGEGSGCVCATI